MGFDTIEINLVCFKVIFRYWFELVVDVTIQDVLVLAELNSSVAMLVVTILCLALM